MTLFLVSEKQFKRNLAHWMVVNLLLLWFFTATDLAHHIRLVQDQEKMAEEGFQLNNHRHRQLLLFLLMTCADLSDQTKDWKVSRTTAVRRFL